MATRKFNHGMDLGFEVISTRPGYPTNEEIIAGIEKRLAYLKNNPDELEEAVGHFDISDVDEEE